MTQLVPPPWESRLADLAPGSRKIYEQAKAFVAGGVTHVARKNRPFPLAVERADGARKWDADGNEYVDFVMGHGALLLGHGDPKTVAAVQEQISQGVLFGASHRIEAEWAALVCELIHAAERVRFTSSGTEAAMLGARIARAKTQRAKILKFPYHFHGWSELGVVALEDATEHGSPGIPPGLMQDIIVCAPTQESVQMALDSGDVAGVIVEPSGARFGQIPMDSGFIEFLRDVTRRSGALLIYDEVITGFRWSPGGFAAKVGVYPDIAILGKILSGGLPSGAVAASAAIMSVFETRDPEWDRLHHVYHPGTFNANALSAAAGVATLTSVASGEPTAAAEKTAAALRSRLQDVLDRREVAGSAYGDSSAFHIYLGPPLDEGGFERAYLRMRGELGAMLRSTMLSHGVDLLGTSGFVSAVHTEEDIERTASAFGRSISELVDAGLIGT